MTNTKNQVIINHKNLLHHVFLLIAFYETLIKIA